MLNYAFDVVFLYIAMLLYLSLLANYSCTVGDTWLIVTLVFTFGILENVEHPCKKAVVKKLYIIRFSKGIWIIDLYF